VIVSLVLRVHPFFLFRDERAATVGAHDLLVILCRGDTEKSGVAMGADEPDHSAGRSSADVA
jgi:hypothetical protein